MRERILDREPSRDLRLYVVWLHQRVTDERGEIDESIVADPRVTQYWDGVGITGTYFAERIPAVSDTQASSTTSSTSLARLRGGRTPRRPSPGAGVPVVSDVEELLTRIRAQL